MAKRKAIKRARKSAPKRKYKKRERDTVIRPSSAELYKPVPHPTMHQTKVDDIEGSIRDIVEDYYNIQSINVATDNIEVETDSSIRNINSNLSEKLWSLGLMIWAVNGEILWLKHHDKMTKR